MIIEGKELERYFDFNDAIIKFIDLFKYDDEEKNERAIAIIGGAFLETIMENILTVFFVDDEEQVQNLLRFDKPIGNFNSRINLAYCLGLIKKDVLKDLKLAGKIRNEFAHNLSATFNSDRIRSWCNELKWHRIAYMQPPENATARDLYQVGVHQLITYLNGVISIARGEKRKIRE